MYLRTIKDRLKKSISKFPKHYFVFDLISDLSLEVGITIYHVFQKKITKAKIFILDLQVTKSLMKFFISFFSKL